MYINHEDYSFSLTRYNTVIRHFIRCVQLFYWRVGFWRQTTKLQTSNLKGWSEHGQTTLLLGSVSLYTMILLSTYHITAVVAKAPRKNVSAPVRNISSPSVGRRKGSSKRIGGNPVKIRPTPSWQKGTYQMQHYELKGRASLSPRLGLA